MLKMSKVLPTPWFLLFAHLAAGCLGVFMAPTNEIKQSNKVDKPNLLDRLINDSLSNRLLADSGTLKGNQVIAEDVPNLVTYLHKHSDYTSFHLLFALRRDHPQVYKKICAEIKASVLCSALKKTRIIDDWSGGDEPAAAAALIEIGLPAVRFLMPLLDDQSEVGFEEGGERFRRADIAFELISAILGVSPAYDHAGENHQCKGIDVLKRELFFSPNHMMLAFTLLEANHALRLWDIPECWHASEFSRPVTVEALSCGGNVLGASIVIWDTRKSVNWVETPMTAKELELAWQAMGDSDPIQAWKAVWQLTRTPAQAIPFLATKLNAQPCIEEKELASLIQQLDDARFAIRDKAMKKLTALGRTAATPLKMALIKSSLAPEMRRRIEMLLQRVETKEITPEQVRWLRAAHVLEHSANIDAKKLLRMLADEPLTIRLVFERWKRLPNGLFQVERASNVVW
jgi:hypothetical protein